MNLSELRREFIDQARGVEPHRRYSRITFAGISEKLDDFSRKLNKLAGSVPNVDPPENLPDIDKSTELTDAEVAALRQEFRSLLEEAKAEVL